MIEHSSATWRRSRTVHARRCSHARMQPRSHAASPCSAPAPPCAPPGFFSVSHPPRKGHRAGWHRQVQQVSGRSLRGQLPRGRSPMLRTLARAPRRMEPCMFRRAHAAARACGRSAGGRAWPERGGTRGRGARQGGAARGLPWCSSRHRHRLLSPQLQVLRRGHVRVRRLQHASVQVRLREARTLGPVRRAAGGQRAAARVAGWRAARRRQRGSLESWGRG